MSAVRLLYATPSLSRSIGGIFDVEKCLAQQFATQGIDIEVIGLEDEHTQQDLPKWLPVVPESYRVTGPSAVGFSFGFLSRLLTSKATVAHIHSLWSYVSYAVYRWSLKSGNPYIITANGMLDKWALNNSKLKKQVARTVVFDKILKHASCIQVNTLAEHDSVRAMGLTNPICIINNGVDLPDQKKAFKAPWNDVEVVRGKKVLLFLSRLHPKKGVHLLLEAWKNLNDHHDGAKEWHLVLVGFQFNGNEYEQDLISYREKLGLSTSTTFLIGMYGDEMTACYVNCDAYILPSFSEGVPMAVLHAWANSKPVVMTRACNLSEGFEADAAIEIEPEVSSIEKGLGQLMENADEDLAAMGKNGRRLVAEKFSWKAVSSELLAVYNWVLNGGIPPPTVK